jgi:hypothetical protein
MKKLRRIAGVACRLETNELGFINIFIEGEPIPEGLSEKEFRLLVHGGQLLMPEWIVRGAVDEPSAIATAEKVIAVRRTGAMVSHHDPEGRILVYHLPPLEVIDEVIEEFERRQQEEEGED